MLERGSRSGTEVPWPVSYDVAMHTSLSKPSSREPQSLEVSLSPGFVSVGALWLSQAPLCQDFRATCRSLSHMACAGPHIHLSLHPAISEGPQHGLPPCPVPSTAPHPALASSLSCRSQTGPAPPLAAECPPSPTKQPTSGGTSSSCHKRCSSPGPALLGAQGAQPPRAAAFHRVSVLAVRPLLGYRGPAGGSPTHPILVTHVDLHAQGPLCVLWGPSLHRPALRTPRFWRGEAVWGVEGPREGAGASRVLSQTTQYPAVQHPQAARMLPPSVWKPGTGDPSI